MRTLDQPRCDWTSVLRRQPVRIVAGELKGGYTNAFEIICCDCGDDPGLDYRDVSSELQRLRGPYPITVGITAYEEHVAQHQQHKRSLRIRPPAGCPARPVRAWHTAGRSQRAIARDLGIDRRQVKHIIDQPS